MAPPQKRNGSRRRNKQLTPASIPNAEVRVGLMRSLLGNYVDVPREANTAIALMSVPLRRGNNGEDGLRIKLWFDFRQRPEQPDKTNHSARPADICRRAEFYFFDLSLSISSTK